MKTTISLLLTVFFLLSFCHAQRDDFKNHLGISLRPSIRVEFWKFEGNPEYDLAPTLQYRRNLTDEFSFLVSVQYRLLEQTYFSDRECWCIIDDPLVYEKYHLLNPGISLRWQNFDVNHPERAQPFLQLGFVQGMRLSREISYPESTYLPNTFYYGFHKGTTWLMLSGGMDFPLTRHFSANLEPQLGIPLTDQLFQKNPIRQYDAGIAISGYYKF